MRIAKVFIKNFRGYGEAATEDGMFRFTHLDDADIVIFTGYNGFGKTGFFEAIEWCITGRIKGVQETNIERYNKITMKNSSYLKYQCETGKREREVMVHVIFDNDWGIVRSTKCSSLEEQGYSDKVFDLHGNEMSQDNIDEMIKQITGQKPEQLLKLSFNGQSRNTDFVKSVNAKERTGTLLEFMGLKNISDIVEKSDSSNNRKLKKAFDDANTKYVNLNEEINSINQIFKNNKWGEIEEYKNTVKNALMELDIVQEELVREGLMDSKILLSATELNELQDSLDKVKVLKEKLENQVNTNEKRIVELTQSRLRYKWRQIQQCLNQAVLVKQFSLKNLEAEKVNFIRLQNIYQTSIKRLEDIKRNVGLEAALAAPVYSEEIVGIAREENAQYVEYLSVYMKLQNIGKIFSISGRYNVNTYNIEKEFRRSEKYVDFLRRQESKISIEKQHIKELEGVYKEQTEMLMQVQNFVNRQNIISSCPVCGGIDFVKEEQNGKDELLAVISSKMASGNTLLKEKNDDIIKLEGRFFAFQEKVEKTIRNRYLTNLNNLVDEIKRLKEDINTACDQRILCNQISNEKYGTSLSVVSSQIERIQEFMKQYQTDDIETIIQNKEKQKRNIENALRTRFLISDIEIFIQEGESKEKDKIMPFFSRRRLLKKAKESVDEIIEYNVGPENATILKEYEKKCKERDTLNQKKMLLEDALQFRLIINENSIKLRDDFLSTMIEDNEMINWIYGKINPHPYFREVKLKLKKNQTDILAAERQEVFLDHIFSEAQMNVLSLSIFLGMVLSVRNYGFTQFFLDDPVQSLDDINEVSFIDLIRALIQSKEVDKNCIISTHDHNFSKLMKIKLRNYKFVEYRFESYGVEGPRISMYTNKL